MGAALLQRSSVEAEAAADKATILLAVQDRQYHPQNGGDMANHFPMTLIALRRIGASEADLKAFAENFGERRRSLRQVVPQGLALTPATWAQHLGNRSAFLDFRGFFEAQLSADGRDAVLAAYLPFLLTGMSKGLFHPLIRTAFAVLQGADGMVADALAYFAIRYAPMFDSIAEDSAYLVNPVPAPAATPGLQVDQGLALTAPTPYSALLRAWRRLPQWAAAAHDGAGYPALRAGAGGGSLSIALALPQDSAFRRDCLHSLDAVFSSAAGVAAPAEDAAPRTADGPGTGGGGAAASAAAAAVARAMCLLAAQLNALHPALTTLHATTAAHGLTTVLPHLPAATRPAALRCYWLWLSALYLEKGAPALSELPPPSADDYLAAVGGGADGGADNAQVDFNSPGRGAPQQQREAWAAALRRVRPSQHSHVIKMAFTCYDLWRSDPQPLYLALVQRMVEHDSPW